METARQAGRGGDATTEFERFVRAYEHRLRIALVATYGAADGRAAAVDAMSWAWENWQRVRVMNNPVGYLYRVGQTAARRSQPRPVPVDLTVAPAADFDIEPELFAALSRLSEQQRIVVLLVHAFGWTIREAAGALELAPSTIQIHAERGLARLRTALEASHAS